MTADTSGRVWSYALELAAGLGCLGIGVDLVTFGRMPSESQRREADRIPRLRLHPHELRLEWMRDPWPDVERAGEVLLGLAADVVDPSRYRPRHDEPLVLAVGRLREVAKNSPPSTAWQRRCLGRWRWPAKATIRRAAAPRTAPAAASVPCPPSERLADWFGRASIYALPARYEPFSLSALEVAMAGCTLVLGDIPSLRETWDGAAAFVDPDDYDELLGHPAPVDRQPGPAPRTRPRARLSRARRR